MKINLKNENIDIMVNSLGAYVEEFRYRDDDIFYPKSQIKVNDKIKNRGGMHPCCPNFSVDEITNLPSHGFARDNEFDILNSGTDFVEMKLCGIGDYVGVDFYISYKIDSNKLYTELKIINNSSITVPIGPAFHPYFYCEDFDIDIKGFDIDRDKLSDTIFLDANDIEFISNEKNISISGKNINIFAVWTDFNGEYVCVEPTYNGVCFVKGMENVYMLNENEEFNQNVVIEIS